MRSPRSRRPQAPKAGGGSPFSEGAPDSRCCENETEQKFIRSPSLSSFANPQEDRTRASASKFLEL